MGRWMIVKPTVFCRDLSDNDDLDIASHEKEAEDQDRTDNGNKDRDIMPGVGGVVEV